MALTPDNNSDLLDNSAALDDTAEIAPAKTWALDFINGTIGGSIDGDEALRQFIRKAIMTERDHYAIYSEDYGCELSSLIGEDITQALLESEVPRIIYESIAYDERIDDAIVEFAKDGDKLFISVTVTPANGGTQFTEGVIF